MTRCLQLRLKYGHSDQDLVQTLVFHLLSVLTMSKRRFRLKLKGMVSL